MKWAVVDAEGDGLHPSKFWCLSFKNKTEAGTYTTNEEMSRFLLSLDMIIGHNIILWDIPNLERVLGIKLKAKVIDTLILSWYLFDKKKKHGLEDWGVEFGIEKPKIDDWVNLDLKDAINRCEKDVDINYKLWEKEKDYLRKLYPSEKDLLTFLDYLYNKISSVKEAEDNRWKIDKEWIINGIDYLTELKENKTSNLIKVMPRVPVVKKKEYPKVYYKKDGSLSNHGLVYSSLLKEKGLPLDYNGTIEIVAGYEDGNPNSSVQLKDWLFSLGWVPRTFKYDGKREIPQINKPRGEGLCDSIKELFELEPNLELLDSLSVISHRISLLKGFLEAEEDGFVKARIAGLTNTLRFKHSEVVNLPKVDTAYGEYPRGSLISSSDKTELCGSDMKSLEDRLKQHYIFPYDRKYVEEMSKPDFDPHLDLALIGKRVTNKQVEAYKTGDKSISKVRGAFKNTNYAAQYGALPPKIAQVAGVSLAEANELYEIYWKRNWAIRKVADMQKVKQIGEDMWLFNPVSKFWYSLRDKKDVFSTLVQGTASYVFDLWVNEVRKVKTLTAQFHDEIVLNVKKGYRKEVEKFLKECIDNVNGRVKLNRRLEVDVNFGHRYSEIH